MLPARMKVVFTQKHSLYSFTRQWKCYVLMYENGKMSPVESIPEIGGRSEFNYDIL
jgi:hypothetical protein